MGEILTEIFYWNIIQKIFIYSYLKITGNAEGISFYSFFMKVLPLRADKPLEHGSKNV